MKKSERLDHLIVALGLADDLDRARRLIMAGEVMVNGVAEVHPASEVDRDLPISLKNEQHLASRAYHKLAGAITAWPEIPVRGSVSADLGAAQGGFTQVLLEHGASRVYAIEAGKGQIDWRLRGDQRVILMEGVNLFDVSALPELVDLLVMDLSFTPLRRAWIHVLPWLREGGWVIALIKPQYEVSHDSERPGGIVTDPRVHDRIVDEVRGLAVEQGLLVKGIIPSPIRGGGGNREWLIAAQKKSPQG